MKRRHLYYPSVIAVSLLVLLSSECRAENTFQTKYAVIHYDRVEDVNDFIWRLGGQKLEFTDDTPLASSRVDRIVNRVEAILDIWPGRFKVDIYLRRGMLESGKIAFYDPKTRSIHISVENATDGVLAHEVAHAIIHKNFGSLLPSKMQEILTQYVDKYLYNDYY